MVGLIDTNVFVHAHTTDHRSAECRRFLAALEAGSVTARIEPMVLHELSYALVHYLRQMTREQVAEYLATVLSWPGVEGEKDLLIETVDRWAKTPGLAFVDAYLATLALRDGRPVYTMNVRHLQSQGVDVPQPLSDGRDK